MSEYLSPGVYADEYESETRLVAEVSTSITGFMGLAIKCLMGGELQLVTSIGDFYRKFGGYLSEDEFGGYREI